MSDPKSDQLPVAHDRSGSWVRRYPILTIAMLVALLGVVYWAVIASDRYVSQTHVIVQKADINVSQGMDFGNLLGALGGGSSHVDQMLLRDFLLSLDMLKILDDKLDLRRHWASTEHDLLSRLWDENEPIEWFHRYYLDRVSVVFDDYSGVLEITAQAFDPKTAQAITSTMVTEGERFINELSHRLAAEQVTFLEEQVESLKNRLLEARREVIRFQNTHKLASPEAAVQSRIELIAKLEATRADLQTKLNAMKAYLVSDNPAVEQTRQQISAIEAQIKKEEQLLASSQQKNALNSVLEEYQQLELAAAFAEEAYKSALTALEKGRVEASRKLKKVSVLQTPTLPEYPEEPRRVYNSIVFVLLALLAAGLFHLIAAIIRDHRD